MSDPGTLPRAARPLVAFPSLLRAHGFAVAPDQTVAFLSAVELLGPRTIEDIRRAGHATLAPPHDRRVEFDALFDQFFLSVRTIAPEVAATEEDELPIQEEGGQLEPLSSDDINEAGQQATSVEALSERRFAPEDPSAALRRLARLAPARMPRRKGRRLRAASRGVRFDMRASLREALRNDGEVVRLPRLRPKMRQRPVLLMIDVSGSMKERTNAHLRLAHTLARAVDRIEVFTFGTRLTRITPAIRIRHPEQALARASGLVSDWDGGTRIGDALQAFLAIPRFAGYARGALVLIVSDGLERGDPAAMTDAVARLARRAWRLDWLTPLAADPGFRPETAALKSILPYIDALADGGSTDRIAAHVLGLARERAA